MANHGDAREKAKKIIYFIVDEFNGKQVDAAKALNVSPATASLWMKEMRLKREIHELTKENKALRADAKGLIASGEVRQNKLFGPTKK